MLRYEMLIDDKPCCGLFRGHAEAKAFIAGCESNFSLVIVLKVRPAYKEEITGF